MGLLSRIDSGRLKANNRLVLPPMATSRAEDGAPTSFHVDHYGAYSRAGVGTVIVEHSYVSPEGRVNPEQLGIDDDSNLEAWRRVAGAIGEHGALGVVQITHAGGATSQEAAGRVVGPSGVRHPRGKEEPAELSREDLARLAECYAQATERALKAGFDGVQIHGAHGYLLNQFLSPLTNIRSDEYGGDLEGRARFPLEVTRAVRQAAGEVPVFYRLGAEDFLPGGLGLEEAGRVAVWLSEAGVDAIDVSGGMGAYPVGKEERAFLVDGVEIPPLYLLPLARKIKAQVDIPVVYTGGITDPRQADLVIRKGECDLVGVGRAQLANKGWAEGIKNILG